MQAMTDHNIFYRCAITMMYRAYRSQLRSLMISSKLLQSAWAFSSQSSICFRISPSSLPSRTASNRVNYSLRSSRREPSNCGMKSPSRSCIGWFRTEVNPKMKSEIWLFSVTTMHRKIMFLDLSPGLLVLLLPCSRIPVGLQISNTNLEKLKPYSKIL